MRSTRWNRTRTAALTGLVGAGLLLVPGTLSDPAQQPAPEPLLLQSPHAHELLTQPAVVDAIEYPNEPNGDGTKGAGGAAVAHRAGGVPVLDADVVARAPEARLYRQRHNGWEPSIGVNDKGHVFVQTRTPNLQPEVMRSTDGGNTFEIVSPTVAGAPVHALSLDPFLYLDKDTGRVFTNNIPPSLTCQPISFSDDSGKSWTNTQICGHFDHQNMFAGPPVTSRTIGYPNLVYYCAINVVALEGGSTMTTCSKSLDGGLTWVHTGTPAYLTSVPPRQGQTGTICSGAVGHGFADRKGVIYLPRVWCGQPYVSISRDEGLTWEQVQVSDIGGVAHEASVVVDSKNNIYYTWIGRDRLPYLAVSRDAGKTWGKPMMIAAPGVHRTSLPKMDIGDDGKIAVAYVGTNTTSDKAADWSWNAYITVTTDVLADDPVFYTGSVNDEADPVTIGDCGPLRCNTLGDFFDVKIGPDGTPWAAFVDACNGRDDCITTFNAVGDRGEGIVGRLVGGPPLLTRKG